jgi:AcrR family transcriptional regulator
VSTRLPAAARREQLLAVALETFAKEGFHATSMNDVADAAGVTKPVLYQHFPSKRALYLALLEDVGNQLLSGIAKAATDASPRAQVEQGFAAYFRWVNDHRDQFTLLFGSGARRDEEFAAAVKRVERAIAGTIAPMIQADIEPDHQRLLAYGLVGVAEGTSRYLVSVGEPFDPDRVARQVADLAWAGLRGVRRV